MRIESRDAAASGFAILPKRRENDCQPIRAPTNLAFMRTILLILLILLLVGALPTWPYSTGWGYYPSGGLILLIVLVVLLVKA
jgi:hypothetical protein